MKQNLGPMVGGLIDVLLFIEWLLFYQFTSELNGFSIRMCIYVLITDSSYLRMV